MMNLFVNNLKVKKTNEKSILITKDDQDGISLAEVDGYAPLEGAELLYVLWSLIGQFFFAEDAPDEAEVADE